MPLVRVTGVLYLSNQLLNQWGILNVLGAVPVLCGFQLLWYSV